MKRYILSNMICVSYLELSAQIISNSSEEKAFLSSQNSRLDEYKWACKRLELLMGYKLPAGDLLRLSFVAEAVLSHRLAYVLFGLSGWRAMARWGSLQSRFCLWQKWGRGGEQKPFPEPLPSPTCGLFHWAQSICQQPTWVPGWITHLWDRARTDAPARMVSSGDPRSLGSTEGERVPG